VAASITHPQDAEEVPAVPSIEVRPFQRRDREQLTGLVNAHIEAVLPAVAVSVNAVLSQLEREPEETIVDPWAVQRATLVAIERDAVAAAAHLIRYAAGPEVSESYRDAAEIRWLVFLPGDEAAADALAAECVATMARWDVAKMYADGALPAPGIYGVPDVWPHVRAALGRAGFVAGDRVEAVLVADVGDLPAGGAAPLEGLTVSRALGGHGTRFSAVLDDRVVAEDVRRRGIGRWLVGHGADWLRLGRVERILDYVIVGEDDAHLAFARALGWRELTRTERGWRRG
jgi:GNAT superfamily N-acetyltransferase